MKMSAGVGSVLALGLALAACHKPLAAPPAPPPKPPTFTASRVRSFSDSLAVTAIADSASAIWVGTAHGLLRWEGARYSLLTTKEGLPADRIAAVAVDAQSSVFIATARGLSRGIKSVWQSFSAAPVGSFFTGLYSDGKTLWAGGPEGLARLRSGKWEHYFADTGVTAISAGFGNTVWVATSGAGVLRIGRGGDKLEHYGHAQGCETDTVRGMVAVDKTLFVVGEDDAQHPRAAYFDGERFYSYALSAPSVIEWAARAGTRTLVGAGQHLYAVSTWTPDPKAPPGSAPPRVEAPVTLSPIPSFVVSPRAIALKPDLPSTALDDPPGSPKPPPAPPPPPPSAKRDKNAPVVPQPPTGPLLLAEESPIRLPDGVTSVSGSERGLLVGSRFLGALRIENDVPRQFRINDLVAGAIRLTVACTTAKDKDDCFLATGGTRAFRFDGQAFEVAAVDPEPGSHVLAVLRNPQGEVLAIHRGGADRQLRISGVDDQGRWTPIGMQAVQVPTGAPELNFAEFAPDGHLWVGLRYIDKDGDARDFGAVELALDSGKAFTHKELPTDVVAMYWKARNEAWFATRSGAARLLDGKLRVFTENDGMESELVRDIGPAPAGESGQIFVATKRGTGRFDGTRWIFPRLGPFYPPATALAHDAHGNVFVGTDKGLFCVGECSPEAIDSSRGLIDDNVADLAVDARNRVWVLTDKGINVVDP